MGEKLVSPELNEITVRFHMNQKGAELLKRLVSGSVDAEMVSKYTALAASYCLLRYVENNTGQAFATGRSALPLRLLDCVVDSIVGLTTFERFISRFTDPLRRRRWGHCLRGNMKNREHSRRKESRRIAPSTAKCSSVFHAGGRGEGGSSRIVHGTTWVSHVRAATH